MAIRLENKCKTCIYCVRFIQICDRTNIINMCCCPSDSDFDVEGGQVMYEVSLFDSSRCTFYEKLSEVK